MSDVVYQKMSTDYLPPIPTNVLKSKILAYAEALRKNVGLENGFELPELIASNNGSIEYIDFLDDDQTDAVVVDPDDSFTIHLSSQTSALRDNFTIAHELAHWLLHWPKVKATHTGSGMRATRQVDPHNNDLIRCEWEANWFASGFLMPADEFKSAYSIGTASEKFGVTQTAVEVRAKTLGLNA